MNPRQWPLFTWVAATVVASFIRLDYAVGDYSIATGVALYCGSLLGARAAMRVQGLALVVLVPLSVFGLAGTVADWGYFAGRIPAAAVAARLAPADGPIPSGWRARLPLLIMAATAIWAAATWREKVLGQQLKVYYTSVIALALFIALWYALRLVARPGRVLGLAAALAPYYLAGTAWTVVAARVAPTSTYELGWADLLFHGFATHLPGDVLTAVVVAFFIDPRRRFAFDRHTTAPE